jgi:hypothetical protein
VTVSVVDASVSVVDTRVEDVVELDVVVTETAGSGCALPRATITTPAAVSAAATPTPAAICVPDGRDRGSRGRTGSGIGVVSSASSRGTGIWIGTVSSSGSITIM